MQLTFSVTLTAARPLRAFKTGEHTVLAVSVSGGAPEVSFSSDDGATWAPVTLPTLAGAAGGDTVFFGFGPWHGYGPELITPQAIFLFIKTTTGSVQGGLLWSLNGGATWTQVWSAAPVGTSTEDVRDLIEMPEFAHFLACGLAA